MRTVKKCTTCGRVTWTCPQCYQRTFCEFCNSCNVHGQEAPAPEMIQPPREKQGRLFIVQVAFFTRRGWTDDFEVRVRARGLAGAVWRGVREARRTHVKRGTHVRQTRVTAIAA